ncbi:hypothetical protein [Candidatus Villigracilis affinis]|uniref:hypothetical protein n=1 Tax=Candidatus Villigracilis affinis TaxID=3140682 RepID=UPI002A223BFC|nr:hypothetical protein [Anaerolineales bacterium]
MKKLSVNHPHCLAGGLPADFTCLYTLIVVNRSPNLLRLMSMACALASRAGDTDHLASWCTPHFVKDRPGDLINMAVTLCLFALPLAGLWASVNRNPSPSVGCSPLTDASFYYQDSLRIIMGQDIPFLRHAPFLPRIPVVSDESNDRNFMFSLAIITAIAAIGIYFTVREVQRTHGTEVAVFLLLILFLYFSHHSTSMSETLGMPPARLVWRWSGAAWKTLTSAAGSLRLIRCRCLP